jgi:hypothetical protein
MRGGRRRGGFGLEWGGPVARPRWRWVEQIGPHMGSPIFQATVLDPSVALQNWFVSSSSDPSCTMQYRIGRRFYRQFFLTEFRSPEYAKS